MSGRFVRSSKYRHVYGNPAKREVWYDNVKVSNNAWDTNLLNASGRYLSLNWNTAGGGAFALIPLERHGKLPDLYPLCRGHTASVLDTAFSPFDDCALASGGDDGQVSLWNVQPEQLSSALESPRARDGGAEDIKPLATFHGGRRRVGHVEFHPTAANVLAAATGDHLVKLFDTEKQVSRVELGGFTDSIQSLAFDWTGSLLVATCRDRKLRLFDTRSRDVQTTDGHGGIKGARVVWCGDKPRLITTGFSKMSERQLFLWDAAQLTKPMRTVSLDSSNGINMPFWCDNNICFIAGKGDGNIRYYELDSDELHYLAEYKSVEPQSGMAFLPRRALNADDNEIARAYKVSYSTIQPVSFYVPRKSDSFQEDIYPPAPSTEPALSADEFFSGKTSSPNLLDFASRTVISGSETDHLKVNKVGEQEPKEESKEESKGVKEPKEPKEESKAPKEEPKEAKEEPKEAKEEPKGPKEEPKEEAKEAKTAAAPAPAPAPAAAPTPSPPSPAIEGLKTQLAERDAHIRALEIEITKLRANQQRIRDVLTLQ